MTEVLYLLTGSFRTSRERLATSDVPNKTLTWLTQLGNQDELKEEVLEYFAKYEKAPYDLEKVSDL